MAQDRNTYAKRQREISKKQKAEDKRARRRKKKEMTADSGDAGHQDQTTLGQVPDGSIGQ